MTQARLGQSRLKLDLVHKCALVFVGTLVLSVFVSPAPLLSAYRAFQIAAMITFGFLWVGRYGIDNSLDHLLVGYVTLGLCIALSALLFPDLVFSSGHRLRGDLIANAGSVGAMGLALALTRRGKRIRLFQRGLFLFFALLLLASRTRSAYAAFFLFLVLAVIAWPRISTVRRAAYLVAGLALVAVLFGAMPDITAWVIRDERSVHSLSGRIPLWRDSLSYVLDYSPWVGLGFQTERTVTLTVNPGLGTGHSSFVSTWLGAGTLGFTAFITFHVALLLKAIRLFLVQGKMGRVFASVSLLGCTLLAALVSEALLVPSPTGFTFWTLATIIPTLARTTSITGVRGLVNHPRLSCRP